MAASAPSSYFLSRYKGTAPAPLHSMSSDPQDRFTGTRPVAPQHAFDNAKLAAFMRECLKVLGTEVRHGEVLRPEQAKAA